MADTAVESPVAGKKKGKAAAKPVKRSKPTHPPTSEMVTEAIGELKERGGSSLQAIKKFIAANYDVDADKVAPFIKKYLKGAVESGALIRTKGKGAAGSFKLDVKPKPASTNPRKPRGVVKKPVKPKKTPVKKAPAKKPAKPVTPSKAKKTAKPPTKPKTPKAKRGVSAKSKTIKKSKK